MSKAPYIRICSRFMFLVYLSNNQNTDDADNDSPPRSDYDAPEHFNSY